MPYQTEELKKGLLEDLGQAQETASKGAESRGAPEEQAFAPRTIRYKNKAIAQGELEANKNKIEEVIQHLTTEAGFTDEIEQGKFQHDLRNKYNKFQLMLLRQAGQLEAEMSKRKMDQRQRQALLGAFVGVASSISEAVVSNIGTKSKNPSLEMAEPGSQRSSVNAPPSLGVDLNIMDQLDRQSSEVGYFKSRPFQQRQTYNDRVNLGVLNQ